MTAPLSQTLLCFSENVSDKVFVFRRMEVEEGDEPEAKRRKEFSKRERSRPTRRKPKVMISTEIETLVESLFLEEE